MTWKRLSRPLLAAALAILAGAACGRPPAADPRMVSEWMHTLYGAVRVERISPPVASRLLAYSTSALYSGLAVGSPSGMQPLAGVLTGFPELPQAQPGLRYDGTFAAVAAQRVVLDSLLVEALPTTRAALRRLADSLGNARSAIGISDDVRDRSLRLGKDIGHAIVAWSRQDRFAETRSRPYNPPRGEALWVNDAPPTVYATQSMSGATEFVAFDNPANLMQAGDAGDRGLILSRPKPADASTLPAVNMAGAAEPYWNEHRPFALRTWDECPLSDFPRYSTDTASAFYREAMDLYRITRDLTPEQRTLALYWADNPGESGTPSGHWIAIASQMVSQQRLSAEEAARLALLTAVAQADAFIASWGYKYHYNTIRPRTYIRRVIDSTWEPLIPNPPFPEHPSGHSTQSAAAATAITELLGAIAFDDSTSLSIGHEVRRFQSFHEASEEAGRSRIYGGIHFEFANVGGRTLGQCIGNVAVERYRAARNR